MEKETKQQQLINKIVANDSVTSPFSGKDFFNCLLNVTHENKSRNDITTELNHREMQKLAVHSNHEILPKQKLHS